MGNYFVTSYNTKLTVKIIIYFSSDSFFRLKAVLYPAYKVIQPILNNGHTYTPYTQKVLLWAAISKTITKTDI